MTILLRPRPSSESDSQRTFSVGIFQACGRPGKGRLPPEPRHILLSWSFLVVTPCNVTGCRTSGHSHAMLFFRSRLASHVRPSGCCALLPFRFIFEPVRQVLRVPQMPWRRPRTCAPHRIATLRRAASRFALPCRGFQGRLCAASQRLCGNLGRGGKSCGHLLRLLRFAARMLWWSPLPTAKWRMHQATATEHDQ